MMTLRGLDTLLYCYNCSMLSPYLISSDMRPLILCRERLTRLLEVLDREGGSCTFRRLNRNYGLYIWEVEQAEESGWVDIVERKPHVGRPSLTVLRLSESISAKLPPWRHQIPKEISIRHWRFALELTSIAPSRNMFGFSRSSATRAYLIAFPRAKSRAGAAASASRLLKDPMVRAARRWFLSTDLGTHKEEMPDTVLGIYSRLIALMAEKEQRDNGQRQKT